MSDINVTVISGTFAWEPEPKYSEEGKCTCPFKVTILRQFGEKEYKDTVDCVAFGATAEVVATGGKGDRVVASGRVGSRSYEKDGKRIYTTQVVVENVEVIPSVEAG